MSAAGPALPRSHARRLREIHRSAGWPCQDPIEIDLLAAGLLSCERTPQGHDTLRLTDAGVQALAAAQRRQRAAFDAHEALVSLTARQLQRDGRIVFTGLSLRARVPRPAQGNAGDPGDAVTAAAADPARLADAPARPVEVPTRWVVARPDVFSLRHTSRPDWLAPAVHEIKVRRADVLGELRRPDKQAAYLDMSSEAWFVLGRDERGRAIAEADELPEAFGVLQLVAGGTRLELLRAAPRRQREPSFGLWMALARAVPLPPEDDEPQARL